jgi:hypothetical protein
MRPRRSSPLCSCCQVVVRVSLRSASTVRVWLPWCRAVSWCPGPGVACPKSRRSGCEPAALESGSFPGCPPGQRGRARGLGRRERPRRSRLKRGENRLPYPVELPAAIEPVHALPGPVEGRPARAPRRGYATGSRRSTDAWPASVGSRASCRPAIAGRAPLRFRPELPDTEFCQVGRSRLVPGSRRYCSARRSCRRESI